MSMLGDAIRASGKGPGRPANAVPTPAPPTGPPKTPENDGRSKLARRRDELAEQVTELHWDLGGLAYEMAIRDHFRLDVLVRRAAVLQERDAELAEVERLLRLEESASAGNCAHCGAPHSRGALFCWQCGATLMERAPSVAFDEAVNSTSDAGDTVVLGERAATAVTDGLLAPEASAATRPPPVAEK
jgi:hypothetical protein